VGASDFCSLILSTILTEVLSNLIFCLLLRYFCAILGQTFRCFLKINLTVSIDIQCFSYHSHHGGHSVRVWKIRYFSKQVSKICEAWGSHSSANKAGCYAIESGRNLTSIGTAFCYHLWEWRVSHASRKKSFAWCTLCIWNWKFNIFLKCWWISTKLHGIRSQKITIQVSLNPSFLW
jgi:hypothetical protein